MEPPLRLLSNKLLLLCLVWAAACGAPEEGDQEERYQLSIHTVFTPDEDGLVWFVTASGGMVSWPETALRGKPWLATVFAGGAELGIDSPLHYGWGTVPESLEFQYTVPEGLADGPYDVAATVYVGTALTEEQRNGPLSELPFPKDGDVSTFTFKHHEVREGDPDFVPGTIRVNIEGEDATLEVANRTYREEDPQEVRSQAFENTYLFLP